MGRSRIQDWLLTCDEQDINKVVAAKDVTQTAICIFGAAKTFISTISKFSVRSIFFVACQDNFGYNIKHK